MLRWIGSGRLADKNQPNGSWSISCHRYASGAFGRGSHYSRWGTDTEKYYLGHVCWKPCLFTRNKPKNAHSSIIFLSYQFLRLWKYIYYLKAFWWSVGNVLSELRNLKSPLEAYIYLQRDKAFAWPFTAILGTNIFPGFSKNALQALTLNKRKIIIIFQFVIPRELKLFRTFTSLVCSSNLSPLNVSYRSCSGPWV